MTYLCISSNANFTAKNKPISSLSFLSFKLNATLGEKHTKN